jgi:hypothetical protein
MSAMITGKVFLRMKSMALESKENDEMGVIRGHKVCGCETLMPVICAD